MYLNSLGPSSRISTLTERATSRLKMAFTDSTSRSYELKFKIFVAFCCFASFNISNLSPLEILTLLEFLNFNNVTYSGLANYVSAVKSSLLLYGIDTSSFSDPRIRLYNRAVMRHRPLQLSIKPIIDIATLQLVAEQCNRMHMGHIFKAAILLAFFSFLRISNLVPHSNSGYNPLKHLSRGDLIFAPLGINILIKWSKTLQNKDKVKVIKVPSLGKSPLCPVAAVKQVLHRSSGNNNSPLFQIKCFDKWVPLTDTRL